MTTDPNDAEDSEWEFSLSDLEEDGDAPEDGETAPTAEADDERTGGNIAGSFTVDEELEAGDIDPEHALFVVVGVVLAITFLFGFVSLFP